MFSKCSILIVDDDPFARGITKHHLTRLEVKNIFEARMVSRLLKHCVRAGCGWLLLTVICLD